MLFIPGEAFLAPALEHDPGLLEYAMARKVHIATPTTLVTMLRTAQYAWQQEALSDNARAVFDLGRELYERLAGLGRHVDGLGQALGKAVSAYNRAVGSLESRVLVSARKLSELGVVDAELEPPRPVEETVRALSAPDLIVEPVPELVAGQARRQHSMAAGQPAASRASASTTQHDQGDRERARRNPVRGPRPDARPGSAVMPPGAAVSRARLTGRGAVLVMLLCSWSADLVAAWLGQDVAGRRWATRRGCRAGRGLRPARGPAARGHRAAGDLPGRAARR